MKTVYILLSKLTQEEMDEKELDYYASSFYDIIEVVGAYSYFMQGIELKNLINNANKIMKKGKKLRFGDGSLSLSDYIKTSRQITRVISTIKKAKNKDGKPLTEVEKYVCAYHYVANRFIYKKEEPGEDSSKSRELNSVMTGDKVVCVGFATTLECICSALGINISNIGVKLDSDRENHAMNMMLFNDTKYKAEGSIFFSDVTNFSTDWACSPMENFEYLSYIIDISNHKLFEMASRDERFDRGYYDEVNDFFIKLNVEEKFSVKTDLGGHRDRRFLKKFFVKLHDMYEKSGRLDYDECKKLMKKYLSREKVRHHDKEIEHIYLDGITHHVLKYSRERIDIPEVLNNIGGDTLKNLSHLAYTDRSMMGKMRLSLARSDEQPQKAKSKQEKKQKNNQVKRKSVIKKRTNLQINKRVDSMQLYVSDILENSSSV